MHVDNIKYRAIVKRKEIRTLFRGTPAQLFLLEGRFTFFLSETYVSSFMILMMFL